MRVSSKSTETVGLPIPIVDLFAGPGGLGEGFSNVVDESGNPAFDVRISIEKDPIAHRTLLLRAFFRAFGKGRAPDAYYDYVSGKISRATLHSNHPEEIEQALHEAKNATLGEAAHQQTDEWIHKAIADKALWVLIGGPPCQAYSMAGRSRRRALGEVKTEQDEKHLLYQEYLRIIQQFQPPFFVMENVKGMLSSTHGGSLIFDKILGDLRNPAPDLEYEIRSFTQSVETSDLKPLDFVIRAEAYGIPQMRHRVILLGVRKDFAKHRHEPLKPSAELVTTGDVLAGLPIIRSRLSKETDSHEAWLGAMREAKDMLTGVKHGMKGKLEELIQKAVEKAEDIHGVGKMFFERSQGMQEMTEPRKLASWYRDPKMLGVVQHEARSHMRSDLQRYVFASCYAEHHTVSPTLRDFPAALLPDHLNAKGNDIIPFADRFRVQVATRPSTTVVSHIAKDGHYYIHHDAAQCRSLTVREAARLQTFPDNYFFEGNRTEQYTQVGNAVPPLLAFQLGKIVQGLVRDSKRVS